MAKKYVLGRKVFTYVNTGTYGTPTWTAIGIIRDETLNLDSEMVDISARDTGDWGAETKGELKMTVDMTLRKDPTETVVQPKLEDSFLNNSALDMLFLDGPVATVGSKGYRADMEVGKLSEKRPKKGVVEIDTNFFVTADGHVPAPFEVEA